MVEIADVDLVNGIPTTGTGTVPTLSRVLTALALVNTNLGIIDGRVDTLESLTAATNASVDTLEALIASTNTKLDTLITRAPAVGRLAAAASPSTALSTEDKTALDLVSTRIDALALLVDTLETLIASTNTKADTQIGHLSSIATSSADTTPVDIKYIPSNAEYELVAASATDQIMGATGAVGDYLSNILVVPLTAAPGTITLKDGTVTVAVFTPPASLTPFNIPIQLLSVQAGGWKLSTGVNLSLVATGNFT